MEISENTIQLLKIIVENIEEINCLNKNYNKLFILQGFNLTDEELAERKKYKKLKKKYQKRINKIIKNL
jgi:hypothetical protein